MRLLPVIICVCIGIWLAFTYPEFAKMAFNYIEMAVTYVLNLIEEYR